MRPAPLTNQKGAATVLMSVLVGFSISAMALALMFNVQNAQDKQVTAQAQVSAQNLAWAGSETFRQLLNLLPLGVIDQLPINQPMPALDKSNVTGLQGSLTPTIVNMKTVDAANGLARHKEITVNLASVNQTSGAGTTLQMVYGIFNFPVKALPKLDPVTFYHDADFEGQVKYQNSTGGEVLTVKGSVFLKSAAAGINTVQATGDITINNPGVVVENATANGNLSLSGGAKVLSQAIGLAGVTIDDAFATSVKSKGAVTYKSQNLSAPYTSYSVSLVEALGNVDVTHQGTYNFKKILSDGTVRLASTTGCTLGYCFETVEAGNKLTAFAAKLKNASSKTNITCNKRNFFIIEGEPAEEVTAPTFTDCVNSAKFKVGSKAHQVIIPPAPLEMTPLKIDVWNHQADANYFVRYVGTRIFVTVKNVRRGASQLDGEYEMIRVGQNDSDIGFLCALKADLTKVDSTCPNATAGVAPPATAIVFCVDGCWAKETSTNAGAGAVTFALKGRIAPGVIFFDGNLNLKLAENIPLLPTASFLASGFITTDGNAGKVAALNFAGKAGGTNVATGATITGTCTNLPRSGDNKIAIELVPSNFCPGTDFDSTAANRLGNVALMAGGWRRSKVEQSFSDYQASDVESETSVAQVQASGHIKYVTTKITPNPQTGKTLTEVIYQDPYSGGDIQIKAANTIYGSIMAGNMFRSEGTSVVYGYITSSAQARTVTSGGGVINYGGLGYLKNYITASTTIDHSIKPSTYEPAFIPGVANGTPEPPKTNDVRVLRSRYL